MDRKVVCAITGQKYTFGQKYYDKKVAEFKTGECFKRNFITRKAKTLLLRGYSINEIRDLLEIDKDTELEPIESVRIKSIIEYYNVNNTDKLDKIDELGTINALKSDPKVIEFINNIT